MEMEEKIMNFSLALITIRTCTILKLSPVSAARVSRVFRHGRGDMSKQALNARLCWVVRMVLGRFGPRLLFFVHNSSQRYSSAGS